MSSQFVEYFASLIFHPFSLVVLIFVIYFYRSLSAKSATAKILPPSPPKLPIIGNLHQLGTLPHRSLHSLSQRHGQFMFLYMGSKPTLVVSSANAAELITKTYDLIFCSRPQTRIVSRLSSGCKDVAFAPYGEYWKQMRSICVMQLLSTTKVQSFRKIRDEEVGLMVERINRYGSSEMNLTGILMRYTNDVTCRVSFSRKYDNEEGLSFKALDEAVKLLGAFTVGDFIPWLSWIDFVSGSEGRLEKVAKQLDDFLGSVIQEQQNRLITKKITDDKSDQEKKDLNFVEILLQVQSEKKEKLPMENIKAVIWDIFAGGTESTSATIEWTISELLRHPRVMEKLQEEIRLNVGGKGRRVCEDDLEKLTYLKAVIKEVLRLHPPGPLLLFREALKDTKVYGFDIAAGTQVIINAWAIHRDPAFWEEPDEFRPERFLNNNSFDFKGQDSRYIPFGGGRRICPGSSFALINVEFVLATLLYEFDWKLPHGMKHEVDMTEASGASVRRRDPLMVIATPYA